MVEQFINEVSSDFMKFISVDDRNKENLIDFVEGENSLSLRFQWDTTSVSLPIN